MMEIISKIFYFSKLTKKKLYSHNLDFQLVLIGKSFSKCLYIILIYFINFNIYSDERKLEGSKVVDIPMYTMDNDRITIWEGLERLDSGKFLLVNFTSSFCKPCKYEIPELIKIKESNPGIELWFVFVGDEVDAIEKKIFELKVNNGNGIKILKDPLSTSLKRLKISAVPITLFVKKGKDITSISVGYEPKKFIEFKNKIIDTLKE